MEIEEKLENEINNNIQNEEVNVEKEQNNFLETTIGKVINTGCDIALRTILPNAIEDEVIRYKKRNIYRWNKRRNKDSDRFCYKPRKKCNRNIYRKIWKCFSSIYSNKIGRNNR